MKKGLFAHKEKKILLAEQFINCQILSPFPTFEMSLKQEIQDLTETLATMWDMPSFFVI